MALILAALGVVFGDIGTSPLYAMSVVFSHDGTGAVPRTKEGVYGIISMIFWLVTLVVSVKYVTLVMKADNNGEGGIMALIALFGQKAGPKRTVSIFLVGLGVFGAALFFGDSMITPAISILSSVEGLKVIEPSLERMVVPITMVIVTGLFMVQKFGTAVVGRIFGPVMLVWFSTLAVLGLSQIVHHPEVLAALSPVYAVKFIALHPIIAFLALAGVFLTVTGAEALYADMGHFGRKAISRAWFFLVFPALMLNYLGQASLILHSSSPTEGVFFLMAPEWGRIPLVILATLATIIASQAVISGAFSVARQAVQLGYLPRLRITHTSDHAGQIYVPWINWMLLAAVLFLVLGFRSSENLAAAYGIAVSICMAVDTLLFFAVAKGSWKRPSWILTSALGFFLLIDLLLISANLPKIPHGGWMPLLVGAAAFTCLSSWQIGRKLVTTLREEKEGRLRDFIESCRSDNPQFQRVPGTAVFLSRSADTAPLALRSNADHNHALHEHVVIASVETCPVPHVPEEERLRVDDLGYDDDGISHVSLRYGFQDDPDVPAALAAAAGQLSHPIDLDNASYFLSKIELRKTQSPGMSRWRKPIFAAMANLAADPVEYFALPRDRTVIMGAHIEF